MRTNRQQKKGLIITGLLILLLSVGYIPLQRELTKTNNTINKINKWYIMISTEGIDVWKQTLKEKFTEKDYRFDEIDSAYVYITEEEAEEKKKEGLIEFRPTKKEVEAELKKEFSEEITEKKDYREKILKVRSFTPLILFSVFIIGAGYFLLAGLPKEQE